MPNLTLRMKTAHIQTNHVDNDGTEQKVVTLDAYMPTAQITLPGATPAKVAKNPNDVLGITGHPHLNLTITMQDMDLAKVLFPYKGRAYRVVITPED